MKSAAVCRDEGGGLSSGPASLYLHLIASWVEVWPALRIPQTSEVW